MKIASDIGTLKKIVQEKKHHPLGYCSMQGLFSKKIVIISRDNEYETMHLGGDVWKLTEAYLAIILLEVLLIVCL